MTDAWRDKAHQLISEMARDAYIKANILPNGQRRKRHAPYTLPAIADQLVECLNDHDEMRAKDIFQHVAFFPEKMAA